MKKVLKIGRFFNSKELRIKAANNDLTESRFGFVIGTAIDKRAVVRNRIKRQAREAVRLLFKEDLIVPSLDVVILLGRGLKDLPFTEIQKKIMEGLQKLRVIKV